MEPYWMLYLHVSDDDDGHRNKIIYPDQLLESAKGNPALVPERKPPSGLLGVCFELYQFCKRRTDTAASPFRKSAC